MECTAIRRPAVSAMPPDSLVEASPAYVYPEKSAAFMQHSAASYFQENFSRCTPSCRHSMQFALQRATTQFVLKYCSEKFPPLEYLGQKSCNLRACSPKHLTKAEVEIPLLFQLSEKHRDRLRCCGL